MKIHLRSLVLCVGVLLASFGVSVTHARSKVERLVEDVAQAFSRSGDVKTTAFAADTSYAVCFTPGQDCEGMIVKEINHAKTSILVQAYEFTSAPIARALSEAKGRGVDVRAILDKSQRTQKYSGATYLRNAQIPVVVDEAPRIAHNKILIIDQDVVVTGSFNFTRSAQMSNAENLLVLKGDANLVRAYTDNWKARYRVSVPY